MKDIKLALDFDSCIANTAPVLMDIISEYIGRYVTHNELDNFHLTECFGITREESDSLIDYLCSMEKTLEMEPIDGSIEFINYWMQNNELAIITNRHDLAPVKAWLYKYGVINPGYISIVSAKDKGPACYSLGITHIVEDHVHNVYNVAKLGVIPIIFKQIWNRKMLSHRSLINQIAYHVSNWNEVLYFLKGYIYEPKIKIC